MEGFQGPRFGDSSSGLRVEPIFPGREGGDSSSEVPGD